MKNLVKKGLEINQNVKILTAVVQNSLNSDSSDQHTLPEEINLPVKTVQQVADLELQLESNHKLRERLVSSTNVVCGNV